MKLTKLFKEFFESEKSGGIILIVCTLISLLIANSTFGIPYNHLFHIKLAGMSIEQWINDGLMAIFFLLIGLELEREVYIGELSSIKNALLPIFAAIGGMVVPAGLYMISNYGTISQSGAGIPMATDIAFALGILSLLGNRVPFSLKILLTALAVIDDLGAILIIAIFYSKEIVLLNLGISLGIFAILLILNRLKVYNLIPYLIGGVFMWYFMHNSGVHATITGVLLAFAIPFGDGGEKSISYKLQHFLHKPVAFVILPLFALANTAIMIGSNFTGIFSEPYGLGIFTGLLFGKPIGIFLFSFIAVMFGIVSLPKDVNFKQLASVGFLGGIGFTMSIFITLLAFDSNEIINNAKLMILVTSLIAGMFGFVLLKLTLNKTGIEETE